MNAPRFKTEAELCQAFAEWVRTGGGDREPWTVYPETGGFDLLLVDKHGRQLGIEAKLRLNAKVCVQALPSQWSGLEGPDWRGVLVPKANRDFAQILRLFGLVVFTPYLACEVRNRLEFSPALYHADMQGFGWYDWNPPKRCELPPLVPDLPAGVPSPVRLTTWKVGALKVLAHLEVHGTITAREVREYGVDPRRFCATDGWLVSRGGGKWARGNVPAFDQQRPDAYAHALAEVRAKAAA